MNDQQQIYPDPDRWNRNKKRQRNRQKNRRKRQTYLIIISIEVLCILLVGIIYLLMENDFLTRILKKSVPASVQTVETELQTEAETSVPETELPETESPDSFLIPEESIYTFLQGPKAWKSKTPWSGSWCELELADSVFSVFGCGLCDLANIYSTLSPYECSPIDMFYYAKEVSDYNPGGGYGAIDWPFMQKTLESSGFTASIHNKNKSYKKFRKAIQNSLTAIVLISSYDDDTYWQDTEGHYVNVWAYDSEDDTVLIGDSGNPDHNRARIPLRYIYDALKTSGEHQYLLVHEYNEDSNTWKHSGISEKWTIPKYYTPK